MVVWVPNKCDPVGPRERVGRRLFSRSKLAGAKEGDTSTGYELYHFEENRGEGEVSLDRIGLTGSDKRIKAVLLPICQAAGAKYSKPREFTGWATAAAKQIQNPAKGPKVVLLASPVEADQALGVARNDYHAHACRPENYEYYEMAAHLKLIFDGENARELVSNVSTVESPSDRVTWYGWVWATMPRTINVLTRIFAMTRFSVRRISKKPMLPEKVREEQ